MKHVKNIWLMLVLKSVVKPIIFCATALISAFFLDHFININSIDLPFQVDQLNELIVVTSLSWFFFEIVNRLEEIWFTNNNHQSKIDKTTASALVKVLRILTLTVSLILFMQIFGFSLSALWAFAGGGGVVAGFAAKDMLSNFFGALSIYLDKPFKVGDWISSPDKNIEGVVEDIGLRITRIRTLDKRPLYVQNSVFNTISIENPSNMSHRRIKESIGLRYQDLEKLNKITKEIADMIRNNKKVDSTQPVVVSLDSYSSISADILVVAYTKVIELEAFFEFKQEIMLEIGHIVLKNKAKIAQLVSAIPSTGEL